MLTVFRHPLLRSYRAPLFSKATAFAILAAALTFVPPLLVAYRSQGFWLRHATHREQPDVHFKHSILLRARLMSGEEIGWATDDMAGYNRLLSVSGQLRVPTVRSYEADHNRDGKKDELELGLDLPLAPGEAVEAVDIFLLFDVKLHRFSSVHLEGLGLLRSSSPSHSGGLSLLSSAADLALVQRQPIAASGRDERFAEPLIRNGGGIFAEDFDMAKALREYHARNLTTRLENAYMSWVPSPSPSPSFSAEVVVRYPEQNITYKPGFWQMMKWGWVQYASLLLVSIFVFRNIKEFVFSRQLLPTQPTTLRLKSQ